MQFSELDLSKTYSYADYLKWAFDERLELIKGKIFRMSPAPSRIHQKIFGRIYAPLYNFLDGQKCEVYSAPFDVRIPRKSAEDKDIVTVLQPDICVVCDSAKLDDKGCLGAPDLVVEILSPGNNQKELQLKYDVYEEAGVKEYWTVYQETRSIIKYKLSPQGKFLSERPLTFGDELTTPLLPGFSLQIDKVSAGLD